MMLGNYLVLNKKLRFNGCIIKHNSMSTTRAIDTMLDVGLDSFSFPPSHKPPLGKLWIPLCKANTVQQSSYYWLGHME